MGDVAMNWIKAVITAALVAAAAFGVAQLRAHWVGEGEARVQARWDAATAKATARAASQAADEYQGDMARFRAAERNADEQDRRERDRSGQLAAARAESEQLRGAIAQLDAADRLPQAADPGASAFAGQAATARELLGRCQARYLAVAASAAELADQVTGLQADAGMCRTAAAR